MPEGMIHGAVVAADPRTVSQQRNSLSRRRQAARDMGLFVS